MDIGTVRTLASSPGQELLRSLPPYDVNKVFSLQRRLRKEGHDPDLVAALLTQQRLRSRAAEKFGEFADEMLYTADGLEQASRLEVAAGHAGRYYQASLATVHDLGCGIGADAVAMSALGVTVQGVDIDPLTAAIADHNLRPWPDSRARAGDALDFEAPADPLHARVGVWFDPARRIPTQTDRNGRSKRVFSLEDIRPSWRYVQQVAEQVPATGAKLSPSMPHDAIPTGTQAQWTSFNGEALECTIWWGPLATTPGRTARIVRGGEPPIEVDEGDVDDDAPAMKPSAGFGRWLYEPDKAVTQAGLLGAVTGPTAGHEVEAGLGYVISDTKVDLPIAKRYEIREVMPFSVRGLRGWLQENNVTGLTIKKRGVRIDEDALRADLKIGRHAGDGDSATVILTRVAGDQTAIIVERD